MLTSDQLNQLRRDLIESAHIDYAEVLDELLDHYASLTEQLMIDGFSFNEANQKAWIRLGNSQGILHVQKRYEKLIKEQIQKQHWTIVRQYFRWPTLMTTVLVGILTYLVAQTVSPGFAWISFTFFSFAPYLLFIPSDITRVWQKRIRKETPLKSLKRYVVYRQARYGNFLYLLVVQLPGLVNVFLTSDSQRANRPFLFEWHVGLSAALTFVAAAYMLTLVELYRHQRIYFAASR